MWECTHSLCVRGTRGPSSEGSTGKGSWCAGGGWKPLRRRSDSASGGRRGQGRTQGVPTALVVAGGAGGKQKDGEWMPQSSQGGAGGLPPSTAGGTVYGKPVDSQVIPRASRKGRTMGCQWGSIRNSFAPGESRVSEEGWWPFSVACPAVQAPCTDLPQNPVHKHDGGCC